MIYEFRCDKMHVTEVFTYDYGLEETRCEVCGRKAHKIPTVFNGNGWDSWRIEKNHREFVRG